MLLNECCDRLIVLDVAECDRLVKPTTDLRRCQHAEGMGGLG